MQDTHISTISTEVIDRFYDAGLQIIPTNRDKRPTVQNWKQYQTGPPQDTTDINSMPWDSCFGIAVINGAPHVECIDIDQKNDTQGTVNEDFISLIRDKYPDLYNKLYIESTPSVGLHVKYKCSAVGGNRILAKSEEGKTIIETRGKGGYTVVAPSPGYAVMQNDICNLPTITPDERRLLFDAALSLDRTPKRTNKIKPAGKNTVSTTNVVIGPGRKFEQAKFLIEETKKQDIDIAPTHTVWVYFGYIFAREFGEQGRELFLDVSWSEEEGNEKYNYIIKDIQEREYTGANGPVSIRSFFYTIGQEYGLYPPEDSAHEIDVCERHILKKGFRYNQITSRIELPGGVCATERDRNDCYLEIRQKQKVPKELFYDVLNSGRVTSYNPLKEFFEEMRHRHFTGSPLDDFLEHIKVRDGIIRSEDGITPIDMKVYIKKWLLSVVAAVYGYVSEMILVLISKEHGTGKSQFFFRLLPDQIQEYFAIDKLDNGKDSDILMSSKLIILDDEYAGKSKRDAAHIKAKASQAVFSVRKAYGRDLEDYKRLSVLCGTTNTTHILNDSTGNRRVIPAQVVSRDYKKSDAINRQDLWADIAHQYWEAVDRGDSSAYKMTEQDYKIIEEISQDNQFVNDHQEYIMKYFEPGKPGDEFMSATEILELITVESETPLRLSPQKLGIELSILGFESVRRFSGRGYFVKRISNGVNFEEDLPF